MAYELIVVGAGPAGLAAALTAAFYKLDTLVLDALRAGGALMNVYPWKVVENYLGFEGMKGCEVAERIVSHVKAKGVEVREDEEVIDVRKVEDSFDVVTGRAVYPARAVILAIGSSFPRRLGVTGESLEGVNYSVSDPAVFRDKRVVIVGGGNTAVESAIALAEAGADVWLVHRRDKLRAPEQSVEALRKAGVKLLLSSEVERIEGKRRVEGVKVLNAEARKTSSISCDAVLVNIGTQPNVELLRRVGVELDSDRVKVNERMETSVRGIFAAGDVVGKWASIPKAIGEGAYAALNALKFVRRLYW